MLHQAALSELLGRDSISRGLGLSYLVKLPFVFSFAPLAALLFERTGGYNMPFLIIGAVLVLAGIMFLATALRQRAVWRPVAEARFPVHL